MDNKTKAIIGLSSALVIGGGLYYLTRPPKKLDTTSKQNASDIANNLGTSYPFFDPRRWTENDDRVEEIINSIPTSKIPQLVIDYRNLFSRDLVTDLQKYLSGWDNVKDKFQPGGISRALKKIKL